MCSPPNDAPVDRVALMMVFLANWQKHNSQTFPITVLSFTELVFSTVSNTQVEFEVTDEKKGRAENLFIDLFIYLLVIIINALMVLRMLRKRKMKTWPFLRVIPILRNKSIDIVTLTRIKIQEKYGMQTLTNHA